MIFDFEMLPFASLALKGLGLTLSAVLALLFSWESSVHHLDALVESALASWGERMLITFLNLSLYHAQNIELDFSLRMFDDELASQGLPSGNRVIFGNQKTASKSSPFAANFKSVGSHLFDLKFSNNLPFLDLDELPNVSLDMTVAIHGSDKFLPVRIDFFFLQK